MVRLEVDARAVTNALLGPSGALSLAMDRAGRNLTNQTKRNLTSGSTKAVDTGRLRASIAYQVRREGTRIIVRVGTDLDYSIYVHEGHGIIRPTRAKFLRFPAGPGTPAAAISKSGFVFAKQVGPVAGRPYLVKSLKSLRLADLLP